MIRTITKPMALLQISSTRDSGSSDEPAPSSKAREISLSRTAGAPGTVGTSTLLIKVSKEKL